MFKIVVPLILCAAAFGSQSLKNRTTNAPSSTSPDANAQTAAVPESSVYQLATRDSLAQDSLTKIQQLSLNPAVMAEVKLLQMEATQQLENSRYRLQALENLYLDGHAAPVELQRAQLNSQAFEFRVTELDRLVAVLPEFIRDAQDSSTATGILVRIPGFASLPATAGLACLHLEADDSLRNLSTAISKQTREVSQRSLRIEKAHLEKLHKRLKAAASATSTPASQQRLRELKQNIQLLDQRISEPHLLSMQDSTFDQPFTHVPESYSQLLLELETHRALKASTQQGIRNEVDAMPQTIGRLETAWQGGAATKAQLNAAYNRQTRLRLMNKQVLADVRSLKNAIGMLRQLKRVPAPQELTDEILLPIRDSLRDHKEFLQANLQSALATQEQMDDRVAEVERVAEKDQFFAGEASAAKLQKRLSTAKTVVLRKRVEMSAAQLKFIETLRHQSDVWRGLSDLLKAERDLVEAELASLTIQHAQQVSQMESRRKLYQAGHAGWLEKENATLEVVRTNNRIQTREARIRVIELELKRTNLLTGEESEVSGRVPYPHHDL